MGNSQYATGLLTYFQSFNWVAGVSMKAETIEAGDFSQVLVTGYKRPYTESRIANTQEQAEAYTRELEQMGCKRVRVLQAQIPTKCVVNHGK